RRVAADSRARAILAALDATVAQLRAVPQQRGTPMPDTVADRLDAALAAERQRAGYPPATGAPPVTPVTPVADLAARRRRRAGWAGLALMAAAAATSVVAISGLPWKTT